MSSQPWNRKGKRKAGPRIPASPPPPSREQIEGWQRTRDRLFQALEKILPRAQLVRHNVLEAGTDDMESSPIHNGALHSAADHLLGIWDGIQAIELNRQACLRLAERSASILLAVLQEVEEAGEDVLDLLSAPLEEFVEVLKQIEEFLSRMAHRSFLKRYLTRDETLREIERCDDLLQDALQMFSLSLQIRYLKQTHSVMELLHDDEELLQKLPLLGVDDLGALSSNPTHASPPSMEEKAEDVLSLLETLQTAPSELDSADHTAVLRAIVENAMTKNSKVENKLDLANDTADLRAILMRALTQNNDAEMLRILQVDREDMPEALESLQRAINDANSEVLPAYTPGAAPPDYEAASIDQKLIVGVIDALRRVNKARANPSNLKTKLVDFELQEKIGSSFFADVFKGQFHGKVAVVKRLAEVTPSSLFFKTRNIWRNLSHPHILELLDATEDGGGILFFICPYQPHGSLAEFLRRVADDEELVRNKHEGELVRFMHEVADGMRYLHENGVVHGNLKAANVLVDNGIHCVVTDFGLSEMKAEVCRISNAPRGALRWHAPEILLGSSLPTREADVYAYAMCCVEILSWGFPPWRHVDNDSVREFVLKDKKRPDIPLTGVDGPALQKLLRNCWADDPAARPSFSAIFVDTADLWNLCKPLASIRSASGPSLPVVPDECTVTDAGTAAVELPEAESPKLMGTPPAIVPPPVFRDITSLHFGSTQSFSEKSPSETKVSIDMVDPAPLQSNKSTKSHFPLLYPPPTAGRLSNDPIAFRSADALVLDKELAEGGTLVSVHSPLDAMSWVEAHYDDPLLSALRARNFEGPMAIPLSPEESALAIFGSIADVSVPQMAKELAQLSGFTVMVRSSADNPILSFASSDKPEPSESVSGNVSVGKVARLRGGAGDDEQPTPKWEGQYHDVTVDLRLKVNDNKVYDVNLCSFIKFKTQSLANSNPAIFRPRPEVLSLVSQEVKLRRGETKLDRSFSNLGFLVHRSNSIIKCDFLDLGYEAPAVKLKRTSQQSSSVTGSGTVGLTAMLIPTFAATGGYTRGGAETLESADEKPLPKCNIRYDPGKSWERADAQKAGKDFQSYDVSWFPEMDPEKVAYEMRVELGLGMYIRHNKPGMPEISSILRNQIVIWVNDPELRSKCCGVMLLTSTYIPNALIDERLTIYSNTTANLSATSTQDTPIGDPVDIPEDTAVSVSVAPLDKSKKKKSSKIGRFLDRLSLKSSNSPGMPSTQELPMYETISRGWDPANMQWKNVLWPTLDHQFRFVDIQKPESAAWKLAWNIDTVPPTTPVIPAVPIVTVSKPPQLNPAVGASTSSITTDASMIASSNSFDKDDATTPSTSVASDGGADLKSLVP